MERLQRVFCGMLALLLGPFAAAQTASERPRSWLDNSYDYVTTTTDTLAQRFDAFFGEADAERESADSVLRLVNEFEWSEDDGTGAKVRLRGKVDLPRLNRRLSVVFGEENDYRNDILPPAGASDSDVGIQYRVLDFARSRIDASVGTNASLDFRSSLRYRYVRPVGERLRLRFTERLYLEEGDGAGTITRGDIDYRVNPSGILRLTADMEYGQETDGTEWGSRVSYLHQLNPKEALGYFAAVSGQTDPGASANTYALGLRYRRSIFRPWIFVEAEPAHLWRRETIDDPRRPVWAISFRIEFLEDIANRRASP